MREQVEVLVIDDYSSSEYLWRPCWELFPGWAICSPSDARNLPRLADYAVDGIGLRSNLVSCIEASRGERVYWEDIAGIYKEKPDFQAL